MFDIGWSELLVIAVVALVVIGPKELPGVIRGLGQIVAKMQRIAAEFRGQFNEAIREAELTDLKKSVDDLRSIANPLQTLKDEVRQSIESAVAPVDTKPVDTKPADPSAIDAKPADPTVAAVHPASPLDLAPPAAEATPPAPETVTAAPESKAESKPA